MSERTQGPWVYVKSEPGLWTVGFYAPDGQWHTDSDHGSQDAAGDRAAYLNGSQKHAAAPALAEALQYIHDAHHPDAADHMPELRGITESQFDALIAAKAEAALALINGVQR